MLNKYKKSHFRFWCLVVVGLMVFAPVKAQTSPADSEAEPKHALEVNARVESSEPQTFAVPAQPAITITTVQPLALQPIAAAQTTTLSEPAPSVSKPMPAKRPPDLENAPVAVVPAPAPVAAAPETAAVPTLTANSAAALATLRELVWQTLIRNPELAQAQAESNQASSRWQQIRKGVLPQTSVSAGIGQEQREYSLTNSTNRYNNQNQVQVRVSQPLFDETLTARIRQASAAMLSGDWALIAVREQTMLKTIELYAELLRQKRLVELARDNLKLHREYVAQMKSIARIDLGRASDLPMAQSRVALAESVLTGRLSKLEGARTQWRSHTTLPSPEQTAIDSGAGILMDLPPVDWPVSLEEAISQAITLSPQIQKAMADTQASREALRAVHAGNLPKLSADVQLQRANNFGGVFGEQRTWSTGVNLQWAWDLALPHASRAAVEGIKATEQATDVQLLRLRSVVESQWFELQASQLVLQSYKSYEVQSMEVVRSHVEQFRIGRRSLLDVLNAENELFTARSNVVTTEIDVSLASWRLLSLRGLLADELDL